ncbi:cytidylyltransferase domain-containing protein [Gillisia hiemivivida]|uniref:Acylneuraminate cytidylyltransferase family protein n=1 Tax=Gillisia hiemivivida TaxID=291190 RepID=A0A5C6ZQ51_9FLAO|nr:acylneuraminate cytidylyltransferase family protein [Gillisia hiemivivida]TXD92853.1 acylneuraminate cytidylyltransferase family protein [Gillisia hiemivivida]
MLVVIPARGGSKGVPGKNIKVLDGKPLIQYTVDLARELFEDSDITVSTDDRAIKNTVEKLGLNVPFIRPDELATDKSGTQEVLIHALNYSKSIGKEYDTILLLQPTSPFRNSEQVREAINLYEKSKDVDMVLSVKETKANPYYILREENSFGYLEPSKVGNFTRRQDCPPVWEINGALYVINVKSLLTSSISHFKKVKKYVMDEETSHDIDTLFDWKFAEFLKSFK